MRLFIYLFTIHTLLIYSCKENSTGSNTDSVLSESKTIINSFEYFRNSNTNIDTLSVSLESSESDINLFFNFFISKRNINSYNFTILQYDTSTISNINFVVNSDFIEILWTSIYEENNMGWEIQRKDSNQSYNTIGFVNGSGTSTEIHHYSFNDENEISSLLFYRIKQIDFNGSYDYPIESKMEIEANDSIDVTFSITSDGGVIKYDGEIAPDSGYALNLPYNIDDKIFFKNSLSHFGKIRIYDFKYAKRPSLNLSETHKQIDFEVSYEIFIQTNGMRTF